VEGGRSRSHVVVGTIHYGALDKGIIVYVKPTITGDEPPDVLQYQTRNRKFPHEPTADQFYDEAQWESYRRLGEHTAAITFGFVKDRWTQGRSAQEDAVPDDGSASRAKRRPSADWLFTELRQEYTPLPAGLADRVLQMSTSISELEAEMVRDHRGRLLREIFPELADVGTVAPITVRGADPDLQDLVWILRITQALEDVFTACRLDTFWNHPVNMGWTNTFARWATAPTFRLWWPLIAPMFGADFGRFLEEFFGTCRNDGLGLRGEVREVDLEKADGLVTRWRQARGTWPPTTHPDARVHAFIVMLGQPGRRAVEVEVAQAAVTISRPIACWTSDDFFVPPSLWGSGLGGRFIRDLVAYLNRCHGISTFKVHVAMPKGQADGIALAKRVSFVEFYKRNRFRLDKPEAGAPDYDVHLTLKL